jgi:hypothetical protein
MAIRGVVTRGSKHCAARPYRAQTRDATRPTARPRVGPYYSPLTFLRFRIRKLSSSRQEVRRATGDAARRSGPAAVLMPRTTTRSRSSSWRWGC